jgi:hypothetical protein
MVMDSLLAYFSLGTLNMIIYGLIGSLVFFFTIVGIISTFRWFVNRATKKALAKKKYKW